MNGLDPIPHLELSQKQPSALLGCPVCNTRFAAKDLAHWAERLQPRWQTQPSVLEHCPCP